MRSVPKTQSAHEWDLELVSGAELWCNLHYFSSQSRSRGSRGPPWAPRGRNRQKTRGRIYHFILPKVCPEDRLPQVDVFLRLRSAPAFRLVPVVLRQWQCTAMREAGYLVAAPTDTPNGFHGGLLKQVHLFQPLLGEREEHLREGETRRDRYDIRHLHKLSDYYL